MKFLLVSHKNLHWVYCFLIYTSVDYSFHDIDNMDMASYADDNTPYTFSTELNTTLKRLKNYTI